VTVALDAPDPATSLAGDGASATECVTCGYPRWRIANHAWWCEAVTVWLARSDAEARRAGGYAGNGHRSRR
jgi:hypothetical protein